jgi:hypothetical protein
MHKRFLLNVILLGLCLGCGTGEYESRIGQRKASSTPDVLGPAEELAGTRVSIRVPRCVSLLPEGTDPKRSQAIPAPGAQQRIYEGFVKDSDGGDIPFYCYFIAMELPKAPGVNLLSQMKSVMEKMPGKPQFAEVHVTSPEGKESKWDMAHAADKSEFYYKGKDGKDSLRSMPDVEEMYLREDAGYFIMIGWQVPANIEQNVGNVGLAELAKAAAGGVSVKPQ